MCSRGGKVSVGLPNPSRIVLPAMIAFLILGICGVIVSINAGGGLLHFCGQFQVVLDTDTCGPETDKFTPSFGETVRPKY